MRCRQLKAKLLATDDTVFPFEKGNCFSCRQLHFDRFSSVLVTTSETSRKLNTLEQRVAISMF